MSNTEQQLRDIEMIIAGEVDSSRKELETDGRLDPRFLFISKNAGGRLEINIVVMPEMQSTLPGAGRDPFAQYLRHIAREIDAIAYFSIMEAWVRRGTKDKPPVRPTSLDWGEDPRSEEEVVAILETGVGTTMAYMPIIRRAGKPPTFAPGATWEKQQRAEGRWVGVLPRSAESP